MFYKVAAFGDGVLLACCGGIAKRCLVEGVLRQR